MTGPARPTGPGDQIRVSDAERNPALDLLGEPASQRKPVRWIVAILSGSNLRGRYRLAGTLNAVSILGGDTIDLRDAEISDGEVNAVSVMGGRQHLPARHRQRGGRGRVDHGWQLAKAASRRSELPAAQR